MDESDAHQKKVIDFPRQYDDGAPKEQQVDPSRSQAPKVPKYEQGHIDPAYFVPNG